METNKVDYAIFSFNQQGKPFGKIGDDMEEVAKAFSALVERVIEQEKNGKLPPINKSITAVIKFTKAECAEMDKELKRIFAAGGYVARITKRENGGGTFLYEIRYRRLGYKITAISTDLREAKKQFIEMTKPQNIGKYAV